MSQQALSVRGCSSRDSNIWEEGQKRAQEGEKTRKENDINSVPKKEAMYLGILIRPLVGKVMQEGKAQKEEGLKGQEHHFVVEEMVHPRQQRKKEQLRHSFFLIVSDTLRFFWSLLE